MGWIIESDTQIWCFSFFFFGLPNSIHCCLNASLAPAFRKVCWFFILCWKSVRWFHIKTFGQLTISWPRLQQKWSSQTRGSKVPNFLSLIFRCHICYMSNFPGAILFLSNLVYYYYPFFFFCNWAYSTTINLVKKKLLWKMVENPISRTIYYPINL